MVWTPFLAGQKATAELLNTRIIEEIMPWTPLASLGTFATNFAAHGSLPPEMRKIRVMGTEEWEFEGMITSSSFAANTTHTMFTFDVGHRVAVEREFAVGGSSSAHYPVRLGLMPSGALTGSVPTAAGGSTSVVWMSGARVLIP